ncbi:hypothetical protein [Methylorubrum sp. SB2]|uniref:hypothetical protein n=1 Tax=Methylorubrum subtropicum TaxID=3138812 RepID=UPI00313A8581
MQAGIEQAKTVRCVQRELARLDGLIARARYKRRIFRTLRGGLGAGATLLVLLKAKVAASLGLKLAIAGVVGLGLAWPVAVLVFVFVAGLVVTILGALMGEGGMSAADFSPSWDGGCERARMRRLKALIALRRAWLAAPAGPAPSIRRDLGRRFLTKKR